MLNKKILSLISIATIGSTAIGCGVLSSSALNNSKHIPTNNILLANNNSNAAVINGNGSLVLKIAPNLQSKNSSYLSVGEMLKIKGESGDFYKVTVQETGATGYISKANSQIITSGLNNSFVADSFNSSVVNVTTDVHLRDNPSMNSTILSNLSNGSTLKILGKQGDWYKVTYGNSTGYIYKLYVSKSSTPNSSSTKITEGTNHPKTSSANATFSNITNKVEANNPKENKKPTIESNIIPVNEEANIYERAGFYRTIGDNSSLISTLEPGTKVMVLEKEDNLYKIKLSDGVTGYVNENTIHFLPVHGKITAATVGNSNGKAIKVYSKADTLSPTLGKIAAGEELNIIKQDNNWCKISFNGKTGYIPAKYVVEK